jgi:hypothetical protein
MHIISVLRPVALGCFSYVVEESNAFPTPVTQSPNKKPISADNRTYPDFETGKRKIPTLGVGHLG